MATKDKKNKIELLLPAGNLESLRAAINNGADAIYLGLDNFNARKSAENFNKDNIYHVIEFCHKKNCKVYITLNTLIKNDEIDGFLTLVSLADSAKADAIIIQDIGLIKTIRKHFPKLKIHLSTQATVTNSDSIPDEIERVILARELDLSQIRNISERHETEIFVHGALCICVSGQCLFSSIAGGRSGNRGNCAQPCRKKYNNRYLLSTMDLCMLDRLPDIINSGVRSLKIEGRLRSPLYVATAAKVYRRYIDLYYTDPKQFKIDESDIDELKIAFNREFTTGFAFNDSIVNNIKPMNRGLFIGILKGDKLHLKRPIKIDDGIAIWEEEIITGTRIRSITKEGEKVKEAQAGDTVDIGIKGEYASIYKTSSVDMCAELGEEIKINNTSPKIKTIKVELPKKSIPAGTPKMIAKVYSKKSVIIADKAKADIIYYDIGNFDIKDLKPVLKNSRLFLATPRFMLDTDIPEIIKKIKGLSPDGLLIGNRGLLTHLKKEKISIRKENIHLDYSFNCFNDLDLGYCSNFGLPIISPELNFEELQGLRNKYFISLVHGDIILMTTKEKLKAPELIDEEGRHFRVRERFGMTEILNSKQLGLFNKINKLTKIGIKYFLIDTEKDIDRYIRIYRKILENKRFNDTKIKKGFTTGHFSRGV